MRVRFYKFLDTTELNPVCDKKLNKLNALLLILLYGKQIENSLFIHTFVIQTFQF